MVVGVGADVNGGGVAGVETIQRHPDIGKLNDAVEKSGGYGVRSPRPGSGGPV